MKIPVKDLLQDITMEGLTLYFKCILLLLLMNLCSLQGNVSVLLRNHVYQITDCLVVTSGIPLYQYMRYVIIT